MTLVDYVVAHTVRGECQCGKCIDKGDHPDPEGHTADLFFFKVALAGEPQADEVRALVKAWPGEFAPCDPFDGGEHGYIELGAWIGDQGLAMQFMGLCSLLGMASLFTPKLLGKLVATDTQHTMAEAGLVTMIAIRREVPA